MLRIREAFAATAFSLVLAAAPVYAQTIDPDFWMADGPVHAVATDAGILYIGGAFSNVGPYTGSAAPIDVTSGAPLASFPRVNGQVFAVISDGGGGWYLGGDFTTVGGQTRNRIAHVASDLSVSGWDPNANGTVRALALRGSTVYAGGYFDNIGGQARTALAALDAATGLATSWNPNPNNPVFALAVNTHSFSCPEGTCFVTNVYVGGDFTNIGGQSRAYLAAIDATTGAASSWNPNPNDRVIAVQAVGNSSVSLRVYAGGFFGVIGGQARNYIAALNAAGNATTWNPNANDLVQTLAVSGGTVYAGGSFTNIGGQARNYIAALNSAGAATTWNPNANLSIQTLAVSGSTVYAGGDFTSIGGQSRNYIAALDAATAVATPWDPNANSLIRSLAVSGSTVYAGGLFTSIGRLARGNIAALDATTGAATTWNPNASGVVRALVVNGSTIYAGGVFASIGGEARASIAALDATTGTATAWNPGADGGVHVLAVTGSTIYVGGSFFNIAGQPRANIAALDATTGAATNWNPIAVGDVLDLAVSGATVYACGTFSNIGGQTRSRIAALDAATGAATTWNPSADDRVLALAVSGSTVYAGGWFSGIGGQFRPGIAALDAATGVATSWDAFTFGGGVYEIAVQGSKVYAGGSFVIIGSSFAARFAEIDATTGLASTAALDGNPWSGANAPVRSIVPAGSRVYVGGDFTTMGSSVAGKIAAVEVETTPPSCDGFESVPEWPACGVTVSLALDIFDVKPDGAGGVFIAWNQNDDVYLQHLTVTGAVAPGWPAGGRAVCTHPELQRGGSVVPDGDNGAFVVWHDRRDDGTFYMPYMQRFSADGVPQWTPNGIPLPGGAIQGGQVGKLPAVSNGSGGMIVFSEHLFVGDILQCVTASGSVAPGWPRPSWTQEMVSDGAGGVFLAYEEHGFGSQWRLNVQHVTAGGSTAPGWPAEGFAATPYSSSRLEIVMTPDVTGGVIVGWIADGASEVVRAQRVLSTPAVAEGWPASGVVLGADAGGKLELRIDSDGEGGAVATWLDGFLVSPTYVAVQHVTAAGTLANGWAPNGVRVAMDAQTQYGPGVASDGAGGAFVSWSTESGLTGAMVTRIGSDGVVASGWNASGTALSTFDLQRTLCIGDGCGGAIVFWAHQDRESVMAMRVERSGHALQCLAVGVLFPGTVTIGPATLTYNGNYSGSLTLETSSTGPAPPSGFQLVPADQPWYYDISLSPPLSQPVTVCIQYDPATLTGAEEDLVLLHYDESAMPPGWVDVTTSHDPGANTLCGLSTLSPFVIAERNPTDAGSLPRPVLALHQNVPNPFNPTTRIEFVTPERGPVRLDIFDIRGRLVRTLLNGLESAGSHRVVWTGDDQHGRQVASGIYIYRLETNQQSLRRRMVLVR